MPSWIPKRPPRALKGRHHGFAVGLRLGLFASIPESFCEPLNQYIVHRSLTLPDVLFEFHATCIVKMIFCGHEKLHRICVQLHVMGIVCWKGGLIGRCLGFGRCHRVVVRRARRVYRAWSGKIPIHDVKGWLEAQELCAFVT